MILHEIHDSSNQKIINLLKSTFSNITEERLIKNYHPDFSTFPGNFFAILEEGRFHKNNGKYLVLVDDGKYMASSGWNIYAEDFEVALLLTRTYTDPSQRGNYNLAKHLLPKILSETNGFKRRWVTMNFHNEKIYKLFNHLSEHKHSDRLDNLSLYKKFKPIGTRTIYNVDQYVVEYTN